jgi:hypothetical protein
MPAWGSADARALVMSCRMASAAVEVRVSTARLRERSLIQSQLAQLAEVGHLEEQLGRPQDIEDGGLFVLQTRPVTA